MNARSILHIVDDADILATPENPGQPPYDPNDRRSFIGGSDTARIMGLAPPQWGTAVDLYFDKVEGEGEPDREREALFKRGKRLEPYAVQILVEDFDVDVVARNIRHQDPAVPYFSAEIDFEWQAPDGTIQNGEIKTVSVFAVDKWGEADTGDIPIEYACQAMWNLGITGRQRTMIGALFGADNMVRYWVERDDETIAGMRDKADEFWNRYVLLREPPPPRTLSDVGRLWPRDNGKAVEATPDIAAAWTTLKLIRQRAAMFEEAKDATEFLIAEHMKEANALTFNGMKLCTYNPQSRTTIDGDLLLAESPELHAKCQRTSTFRVMRTAQNRKG